MFKEVNHKVSSRYSPKWVYVAVISLLLSYSCKKEKINFQRDTAIERITENLSGTRIVDLFGYDHVIANGDSLTNFVIPIHPSDPAYKENHYKFPGTKYFPQDGRMGNSWWSVENVDAKVGAIWQVPAALFGSDHTLNLTLQNLDTDGNPYEMANFSIGLENNKPVDYYVVNSAVMDGKADYLMTERDETEPKKGYFKIRVINLSFKIGPRSNFNGPFEEHYGKISLAYADGRPVSNATSNVDPLKKVSDYVEIPYGTYQFKILNEKGREIAGATGNTPNRIIDPPSSSMPRSIFDPSYIVYAPIQTYQPGGVYTIVVNPFGCEFFKNELNYTDFKYQNSFKIIVDKKPEVNQSFARIQAVNALPEQTVSFRLNGETLTENLKYAAASAYQTKSTGKHQIEAVDQTGKVLAQMERTLDPGMNYTLWLYPTPEGPAKIVVTNNDLSGVLHAGTSEEDASYDYRYFAMPFSKRFLNLCPDVPYLTVTAKNGQVLGDKKDNPAVYNLKPGQAPERFPYTWGDWSSREYEILAYRSTPQVTPGVWASDIKILTNENFIARKELYTSGAKKMPFHEPGIYSVALIGRTGSQVPEAFKAKMIVVKHNL